jgi:hypothetical protein
VPGALERSDTFADLKAQLQEAGLAAAEAEDLARLAATYIVTGPPSAESLPRMAAGATALVAVDSGSRGVVLRAGSPDMQALIHVPHEQQAAAPAVVRGESVVVRRLRGVGRGEIELNPRHPWSFKVQAPTWNTLLDAAGLDVRSIHVDSGATRLECFLGRPKGVVPIHISSGVVGVALHRQEGTAVVATVHSGAVKVRLDDFSTKVGVLDVHWQSEDALAARDRYELDVSSGAVKVALDSYTPKDEHIELAAPEQGAGGRPVSALEILLDGVEARVKATR